MGATAVPLPTSYRCLNKKGATRLEDGPPEVANSRQQAATEL